MFTDADNRFRHQQFARAERAVSLLDGLKGRFGLMARFVAKGLAEPLSEEAFVWLWTALEIFPMAGTADIKPISEFLSRYTGEPPAVVKERLKIGWLSLVSG